MVGFYLNNLNVSSAEWKCLVLERKQTFNMNINEYANKNADISCLLRINVNCSETHERTATDEKMDFLHLLTIRQILQSLI